MIPQFDQSTQDCIDSCGECHDVCTAALAHCLQQGGKHAEPSHIKVLVDCADLCRLSADFMLRGSEFQMDMCRACAEVCARCAADCRRMGEDEVMKHCAETCDACAATCRRMSTRAAA